MLKDITFVDNKKKIFCYLRGTHHFALFYNIFLQNPDIEFYVHSNFINEDEYRKSKLYDLENVFFVTNINYFKYKFEIFGAFITTDAQATAAHLYSLRLIALFNELRIPVFEMQHGLFQLGLHYSDVFTKENFHADSLATKSFADYIFTYYPIDNYNNTTVIGYPPFTKEEKAYGGNYVLILSNLHWETYKEEEKYNFYKTVLQFVQEHPEKLFVWKFHLGEIIKDNKKIIEDLFTIYPAAKQNIIFYHENDMLKRLPLSALIQKSDFVISTVSTVLLDCEIYKKRTYIYKCPANECLINKMKKPPVFNNYAELAALIQENKTFVSGLLYKYNNNEFKTCIDNLYKVPDIARTDMLKIYLKYEFH